MAFTRNEVRKILGDAHTEELENQLVNLHLGVVDPLKDKLDELNRQIASYKEDSEKLKTVQRELDELKGGEDWKAKYEKEHSDFDAYKTQIAADAETAKVKAAYKKLLTEEKISEKTLESILGVTDYSKMKLDKDGNLNDVEGLKKTIDEKWGGFKVTTRQRGESVDTPPAQDKGGADMSIREKTAAWHASKFGSTQTAKGENTK